MALPDGVEIVERLPTAEELCRIFRETGDDRWFNLDMIPKALENSLFGVVAITNGQVIGAGRIVGDDAIFLYIQDICVSPAYQRKGIGTAIMDALMRYIDEHAAWQTYVSLFTTADKAPFFERYSFEGPTLLYGMCTKKIPGRKITR